MARLKNNRHERFCREYVANGFNGAAAARAVGTSIASGKQMASEWLTIPNVLQRVQQLNDDILEDVIITKKEVIAEMVKLATFDLRTLYDDDGRLMNVHEMDASAAVSVQEVEVADGIPVKIKAGRDKRAALSELMKHYNAFEDHQKSGQGEMHIHFDDKDERA